MYMYVCTYVCMYVRTYVRMSVCLSVCMYVHNCMYTIVYIEIEWYRLNGKWRLMMVDEWCSDRKISVWWVEFLESRNPWENRQSWTAKKSTTKMEVWMGKSSTDYVCSTALDYRMVNMFRFTKEKTWICFKYV